MKKQRIQDKIICNFNSARFSVIEPLLLKFARLRYCKNYNKNDNNPLISITIPTYDRGKLLIERTLPSILSQSYKNFEIIIVGDYSPQDTVNVLSSIKDPRIKFINLKKRTRYPDDPTFRWFISGVEPSNYALKIAKGKWITYFDDDDIMSPDFLYTLLSSAQDGNYEFVAGLYEEEREGTISVKGYEVDGEYVFGGHSTWLYRSYLSFFKYNINSWRKLYNCPQDIDLQIRMRNAGVRMKLVNKVVSYIRPRPGLSTIGLEARLKS
jgi:glycosyltransferase involved in cell wall biosynthesis